MTLLLFLLGERIHGAAKRLVDETHVRAIGAMMNKVGQEPLDEWIARMVRGGRGFYDAMIIDLRLAQAGSGRADFNANISIISKSASEWNDLSFKGKSCSRVAGMALRLRSWLT